jgi:hypothetical protein
VSSGTVLDAELPLGSLFGSFSKGDQQPDGRVAHNQKPLIILGVDTEILATRALRAGKTRKQVRALLGVCNATINFCWINLAEIGGYERSSGIR